MSDLLQEFDNFSDEDCEGDISDIETFEIGDNKIESVAQVEEDKVTSRVSATTPKTGYGYSPPNELKKEIMLEVRDLLTIFVNQAAKQVTPGSESTSSSTGPDGDALTNNLTPKHPNKQKTS